MGEVIQLNKPSDGDKTFMRCPCTPDGADFAVVVIVAQHPIVCALVCTECEQEIPVNNGMIGYE